jgi:hypothetical protein
MALLSLLLEGHEAAWRIPELHPLREAHPWAGQKKLLELRFHMVGQPSLEVAIFGEYVRHVRANHPAAPIPPLFADEALFDDARRLLQALGEPAFFEPMNSDGSAEGSGDEGFGDLETEGRWQRASFEAAVSSTDPAERARLFDALARTHFKAFAQQNRTFLDLDAGLAVMTAHAASLGFEGVVLFLDELVLWLAAGAANAAWLHGEVQKASKLVEAQDANRKIPIVSFIARQRDLAEMVGEEYAGAENARLRDSLRWWEGRFDTISLEDRNLPAIAEKRVLTPKSPEAKTTLDEAFAKMQRAAGSAWATLLGHQDQEAFRKLYPFSPALVETLVALSNSLQRQRTAIKLLMEILVDHIPDLQLGGLVPVGDLFDLLAVGDDTADGVMRARFEAAKHLYKYQLLPVIHENNGTGTAARCQRLRPDHRASLGCSGCPESACRNDNRLLKTLLLAALVPEALKDLTVSRLVQLNHGTLKTPIPGTEANLAAGRLQNYASKVGQPHFGNQKDPRVDIVIGGADLGPILEQASGVDASISRQQLLRDLLFEAMGVDKTVEWGQDHVIEWRETRRLGHIRFGNVRKLAPEILRCAENHDWRLVVDYPFDDANHGPNEDLAVAERIRDEGSGTWTLVWLPSFFSEATNKLLGELVVLEHILQTQASIKQYTQHLTLDQQRQAQLDLQNLRNQKRARLMGVIAQAYGLSRASEHDLDPSRSLDSHLHVLKPGAQVRIGLAATLDSALDSFVPALLEQRYPRHPMFTQKLTKQRIARLYDLFSQLVEAEDKRLMLDQGTLKELAGTLGVLGLVRITETAVHLVEDLTLQEIERKRQQRTLDHPTVAEVRSFIDEGRKMGLELATADLVVRAYARWAMRTFVRYGQPFEPQAGVAMPDEVVLEKPPLPGQKEWSGALELAGAAFGITMRGKALHADNVKRFEAMLNEALGKTAQGCSKLPGLLGARLSELGLPATSDRAATAASAADLCARLAGKSGLDQVRALAGFEPKTSAQALGRSLGAAGEAAAALENKLIFGSFQQVKARGDVLAGGAKLLDDIAEALRQDELHVKLSPRLRELAERAQELLAVRVEPVTGPVATPTVGPVVSPTAGRVAGPVVTPVLGPEWRMVEKKAGDLSRGSVRERLHALVDELEAELSSEAQGEVLEVVLTLRARVKR